ncbi:SHOCT domain-containing protein [Pseudarthrobacter sp. So.54]
MPGADGAAAGCVSGGGPASATACRRGISNEAIAQLKELGALKAQGILTEEEFSTQKAKILGG